MMEPPEKQATQISIVIPVFNESENLRPLQEELASVLDGMGIGHEIIYVDDGSKDDSLQVLEALAAENPRVKVIAFRRNFGQTAAMTAGIDHAQGQVIFTIDADLQNNPQDIPKLLEQINQGYDVVSGWRRKRRDPWLTRRLPSWLANKLISWITGVRLHDYGCTLKAYRREVLENIRLYGEMHRFIPSHTAWVGARVTEIEVDHRPRRHGRSKYGLARTVKVILDLLTVKFLGSYATKPNYVFGGCGMILILLGLIAGVFQVIRKVFFYGEWMSPVLLLMVLFWIVGVQFILMGLLAEIMIRSYHESQHKPIYFIKKTINLKGLS